MQQLVDECAGEMMQVGTRLRIDIAQETQRTLQLLLANGFSPLA